MCNFADRRVSEKGAYTYIIITLIKKIYNNNHSILKIIYIIVVLKQQ